MPSHNDTPENMDGFYEAVRDTAYFLWQEAGQPDGRSDEFWYRALDIHYRSRAYGIWMNKLEGQRGQEGEQGQEGQEGAEDNPVDREPIGDVSDTDLSSRETRNLARGIEEERDA